MAETRRNVPKGKNEIVLGESSRLNNRSFLDAVFEPPKGPHLPITAVDQETLDSAFYLLKGFPGNVIPGVKRRTVLFGVGPKAREGAYPLSY